MKKIKILVLLCISSISINAQDVAWLNTIGAEGYDTVSKVEIDTDNNYYILGEFSETVDFDPGNDVFNLTSSASRATYLQKLDENGVFIWAVAFDSQEFLQQYDIAVNNLGQIAITGTFTGTYDLDPTLGEFIVTSQGENDFYIVLLNSDGAFVNAQTWGNSSNQYANNIVATSSNSFMICGAFTGTIDFDPGVGTAIFTASNNSFDAFILEIANNGDYIQSFTFGEGGDIFPYKLKIDVNQDVILSGNYNDSVDFDPSANSAILTTNGDTNIFITKFSSTLSYLWAKSFGSGLFDQRLRNMDLDSQGNSYIAGAFRNTLDADPSTAVFNLTSNGGDDAFLIKLDSAGVLLWAQSLGGPGDFDDAFDIAINTDDEVFVSGKFLETVDFDSGAETYELTSNGYKDIFIMSLDATGGFQNAYSMGGIELDAGVTIAVDSNGNVVLGGTFRDTADLDPGFGVNNITSSGDADAFLMKLNNLILGVDNNTISTSEIVAYPNPSTGIIHLNVPNASSAINITISNLLGQVVIEQKFPQGENIKLRLPEANGVYLCNVNAGNTSQIIKLIKE